MPDDYYKNTVIGPLPIDWNVTNLERVALDFFSGGTPSTNCADFWNGEIEWTTSAQIGEASSSDIYLKKGARFITELGLKNSASKLVPRNNLLIGTRVGVGKVAINLIDVAISQDLTAIIIDNSQVSPEFLVYAIRSDVIQKKILSKKRGTTIKGIPRDDLRTIPIPLPPLAEQRLIAHVLTTVRRAIEATEKVIAAAKELKRSLMKYLFTYGPTPIDQAEQVKLKETEIGLVPEGWQKVTLEQVVEPRSAIVEPDDFPDLPYVGLEHIDPGETNLKRWGQANEVKSAKARFYIGDILYGKLRPYLDKAVLATFDGICSTDILVFTPDNDVLGEYIVNHLHTPSFIQHAIATTTGVNHPRTSWGAIRGYSFHLPTFEEQRTIIELLNSLNLKIEAGTRCYVALEALFDSLLHHLMTGKVRVNTLIPSPSPSQGEGGHSSPPGGEGR